MAGSGATRLDVYVDPLCPWCAKFDETQRGAIAKWLAAGSITLAVHPLVFLDPSSEGSAYSTRAATALAATAAQRPSMLVEYLTTLFEHQPAEGTTGLTDDELVHLAPRPAVTAVGAALHSRPYDAWLAAGTKEALSGAIRATPSVAIDGKVFAGSLFGSSFAAAVDQAIAKRSH